MSKSLTDQEIRERLVGRTTEELISLRDKAKKLNTPRALAVRYSIILELLRRYSRRKYFEGETLKEWEDRTRREDQADYED